MATKRIKDISTTATTFAADDFIALDASSVGTRKMAKASLITQVGANYLEKADNLSDVADKDTSKLNLEVPNVGTAANEVPVNGMLGDLAFQSSAGVVVDDLTVDGQLTAAVGKPMPVNAPSMRFDGVDDEVSFAATTDSPYSFTNGTDDTPFAITCWAKMTDATSFVVVSKQQSAREYVFRTDSVDKLRLNLSDGTNIPETEANAALTEYENQWVHLCVTYSGSGPNSSRAFSDAASGIQFYINAKLVATTATNKASYSGMNASSDQVRIGKQSTAFADGEIRDVKLFNKELSAAEVKEVYSNGQLPESFAESTGGAQIYTGDSSTFAGGLGNWTEQGSTAITVAASGGKMVVTNTASTSGTRGAVNVVDGDIARKKYRLTFTSQAASGTGQSCRVRSYNFGAFASISNLKNGTDSGGFFYFTPSGTETVHSFELVGQANTGSEYILIDLQPNTGAGEVYNFDNITLTQIGAVLDARAEQFDTSTGKLYDLSGNDFVGTQSGGVSLLGREFPVYETGTWTPSVTFGGSSTGIALTSEGIYTRIGNTVTIHGVITFTDKGGESGSARITGLPFTAANTNGSYQCGVIGFAANLLSLVGTPTFAVQFNNYPHLGNLPNSINNYGL